MRPEPGQPSRDAALIATIEDLHRQLAASERRCRQLVNEGSDWAERDRLEAQLARSRKMEALGMLTAGAAHDFNNLLSIMVSYTSFALAAMPLEGAIRRDLEQVAEAGARAVALTRKLLTFGRQQLLRLDTINLNTMLTALAPRLRRLLAERSKLSLVLAPGLGNLRTDPDQVEQLIMSLAVNAREAMPDGGLLTLETANMTTAAAAQEQLCSAASSHVKLTVSDTGSGIEASALTRIFEPFFTTKAAGQGNGLGLSTVLCIVQENGGQVDVRSEPGKGTSFEIVLPRADRLAAS